MTVPSKRGPANPDSTRYLRVGTMTVDLDTRHVVVDNRLTPLPACAFDYLVTLLRHYPEPVSYKTLVGEAQKQRLNQLEAQDLARLNIYMLRRALEPNMQQPRYILTVAGYGYRMAV